MSIPNTPENDAQQTSAAPEAPVTHQPVTHEVPAPTVAAPSYTAPAPEAPAAPAKSDSTTLSITSFVLGLCSIVLGWTFIAPIVGLVLGIMARKREPRGRTFANWGIGLNSAMLILSALLIILFVVFAAFFLPFVIASDSGYYIN